MDFPPFLSFFKTILPKTRISQQLLQKCFLALSISLLLFTLICTKTLALLPEKTKKVMIPRLTKLGLTLEQISEIVELSIEEVKNVV